MSPEEFKIQQLKKQCGKMAEDHAEEVAELHLQYTVRIQSLQARVEELEAAMEEGRRELEKMKRAKRKSSASPPDVVPGELEEDGPAN